IQKCIPLVGLAVQLILEKDRGRGFERFPSQRHSGFLGREVPLLRIAFLASSDEVGPCIASTASPGEHVIDSEVASRAAVLAFKVIAFEYILPGKRNALVGGVNVSVESYDGGHRETLRDGMQPVPVCRLNQLTFLQVNQHECTLNGTNHEWTKILIQYQHSADHAGNIESNFQVTKAGWRFSEQYPSGLDELMGNPAGVDIPNAVRCEAIHPYLTRGMDNLFLPQNDTDVVDLIGATAEEREAARLTVAHTIHRPAFLGLLNRIAVGTVATGAEFLLQEP